MKRAVQITCLLGSSVLGWGCSFNSTIRVPTVAPRNPNVEKQSYTIHDPYADRDIGPDIQARPPGFDRARSEPKRALEARAAVERTRQLQQQSPQAPPEQPPPTGSRYPHTVRP